MKIAHLCLLVACLLPIVCAGIAKWGSFSRPRSQGGYDNHDPRAWLARQQGYRARANAAQANSFEALPLFIAAVLVAQQTGVAPTTVDALAVAFVALRMAYIGLYVADRAAARSLVWMAGVGVCVALFVLAA
ncbi:MAG: hypothetical protein RI988_4094 [Pseudomonadota bacterium]